MLVPYIIKQKGHIMKIDEIKSGMGFENKHGEFFVVAESNTKQTGNKPIAVYFDSKKQKPEWISFSLFSITEIKTKTLPSWHIITKVYEPVGFGANGWKLVWECKPFTIANLKNGMRLVNKKGEQFAYLYNPEDVGKSFVSPITGSQGWDYITAYNDDLTYRGEWENEDIVKVYSVEKDSICIPIAQDRSAFTLVWEREE